MAGRGRPRALLTVSDSDRVVLVRWSKRPTSPHSIAQRARIVLLAADGLSNNEVADKVGCNQATVVKWRKRFIERGLDGLPDDPRPGAPRSITDDDVEAVIVRTLEEQPTDATHWSTRDLAAKAGISPSSVARDLNVKVAEYLSLPSLEAYIVASQDEPIVWIWQRSTEGARDFPKQPVEINGRDQAIALSFFGFSIAMEPLYRGIGTAPQS